MNKIVLFAFVLVLVSGGILFAQTTPPTTTVNGTIGLNAGRLVLKSGTMTYYTRELERYIGFIDGLKDGAQVTLEGYVSAPSIEGATERLFFPVKLTLNGKTYEVGTAMANYWGSEHPLANGRTGRGVSRRWGR